MEFLIRAYLQIFQLYRAMTPGSRATSGLLTAFAILGGGYLYLHQGTTAEVDLLQGMSIAPSQLPTMQAAFAKANLKNYAIRGTSIFVPQGQEADYMAALVGASALPPRLGVAQHNAVNSSSLFELGAQHDQRMKIAKQEELAHGICQIPGIESAYVLYDVDNRPGPFAPKLITATVMIKPCEGKRLEESLVMAIREMLPGAIAGLKSENVAVTDLATGRTWHGVAAENGAADDNLYISLKHTYEQDLKLKVLNALSYIPDVTVATNVNLTRERIAKTVAKPSPQDAKDRASVAAVAPPIGKDKQPVTAAVSPPKTVPAASETVEKETIGWAPRSAKVSIGVPMNYFRRVWQNRNASSGGKSPAPSQIALDPICAEETAKIQRHIAQLLPAADGIMSAADLVTVTPFQDVSASPSALSETQQQLWNWLQKSWRIVVATVLALVGLATLRTMLRPARPHASDADAASIADETSAEDANQEAATSVVPAPHASRFHTAGPMVREELSEMVENDPDAAANVLRSWIGQVG